jgi:hypothetical protein
MPIIVVAPYFNLFFLSFILIKKLRRLFDKKPLGIYSHFIL